MKRFGFMFAALMVGVLIGNFTSLAKASDYCQLNDPHTGLSANVTLTSNGLSVHFLSDVNINRVFDTGHSRAYVMFDQLPAK